MDSVYFAICFTILAGIIKNYVYINKKCLYIIRKCVYMYNVYRTDLCLVDNTSGSFSKYLCGPEKGRSISETPVSTAYLLLVYLVTAFVPSLTACLASSPGRRRRTAV